MHDWAEFRHFWYLLTILEKGGFRLAAEELHTSQPNLTVQARQFQERASISLYRKAKDGRIQPTETGRAFIALARSVLEVRDETIEALMAIERGELSSVRLGCSPLVDQTLFRTLCTTHKNLLPGCAIRPNHGDMVQLIEEVLNGSLDAAVVTLPLKHPDLRIEALSQDRLVACLRRDHPLAQKQASRRVICAMFATARSFASPAASSRVSGRGRRTVLSFCRLRMRPASATPSSTRTRMSEIGTSSPMARFC